MYDLDLLIEKNFDDVCKMTPLGCAIIFIVVREKMLFAHIKSIIYFECSLTVACLLFQFCI